MVDLSNVKNNVSVQQYTYGIINFLLTISRFYAYFQSLNELLVCIDCIIFISLDTLLKIRGGN